MKVALIGDVHANLPALEAVLTHAYQQGVEAIWNVGDFVGYGAFPDGVVKRLQNENALSIIGNYDAKVLKVNEKLDKLQKKRKHQLDVAALELVGEYLGRLDDGVVKAVARYMGEDPIVYLCTADAIKAGYITTKKKQRHK